MNQFRYAFLTLLSLTVVTTGCQSDGQGATTNDQPDPQNVSYTGRKTLGAVVNANASGSETSMVNQDLLQGLYFKEIEIVAYDYRPGAEVQTGSFGFFSNDPNYPRPAKDWSWWTIVQSGHPAGRDNVIKPGAKLDFAALNGEYGASELTHISDEFALKVKKFQIDFLEVSLHRAGIIYNNAYYGNSTGIDRHVGEQDPLYKFPEWNLIPRTYVNPFFPSYSETTWFNPSTWMGQGGEASVNIIFARSDWFPNSVVIEMQQDPENANKSHIAHTSIELNDAQRAIISDLVDKGTRRRFYNHLVIVPYDGPVSAYFKLPKSKDSSTALSNAEGAEADKDQEPVISNPAVDSTCTKILGCGEVSKTEFPVSKLVVNVDLNLSDTLADTTDFSNLKTIGFKGDTNKVPFGLKISFKMNSAED